MSTYFYDQPTTSRRRNSYLYPNTTPGSLRIFNIYEVFGRTGFRVSPSTFVYPRKSLCTLCVSFPDANLVLAETEGIPLTMYVLADLDSEAGFKLVEEALKSIARRIHCCFCLIH
jgi:UDP-glucose:glycoprotein glucosyltransferase